MKLAEAVAKWLEEKGVNHVFGVNGGANLHLIHGIADVTQIKFIPTAHEQGAGFAADAFGRIRGLGVATATSGPGATNLITSIAASWQDSTPTLYLVGNCATFRKGSKFKVRNYGFQELEFVDMVKGITKSAVQVSDPNQILRKLDHAYLIATSGRKGPVVVDIPDDLQRMDVEYDNLPRYQDPWRPPEKSTWWYFDLIEAIACSKRPVFVWGAGIRPYAKDALALAEKLQIPVITSWGAIDLIDHDHPLMCGGFGTHGVRAANFTVQNADLLIVIGCRLDTKATGTPSKFAPHAKIWMVDLDINEINKMQLLGRAVTGIELDAGEFVGAVSALVLARAAHDLNNSTWDYPEWVEWLRKTQYWKKTYVPQGKVYDLMKEIARYTTADDIIVSDTGNTYGWIMQGFPFKGERFIHASNYTPMGYGLGASIGAAFTGRRVVCIVGDGGALMSIQELATIKRHYLNVKIILLDNKGHGMCRHTQRQWLDSNYYATSVKGGLGFPNWEPLFETFGFPHIYYDDYEDSLAAMLLFDPDTEGPAARVISVDPMESLAFQARYGSPIEDSDPPLPREELMEQMIGDKNLEAFNAGKKGSILDNPFQGDEARHFVEGWVSK